MIKIVAILFWALVYFQMFNVNGHSADSLKRMVDGKTEFAKWEVNGKYFYTDAEKDRAVAAFAGISTMSVIVKPANLRNYDTVLSSVAGRNYDNVASGDQDLILEALKDEVKRLRILIDLNDVGIVDYTQLIDDSKQKINYLERKFVNTIR